MFWDSLRLPRFPEISSIFRDFRSKIFRDFLTFSQMSKIFQISLRFSKYSEISEIFSHFARFHRFSKISQIFRDFQDVPRSNIFDNILIFWYVRYHKFNNFDVFHIFNNFDIFNIFDFGGQTSKRAGGQACGRANFKTKSTPKHN